MTRAKKGGTQNGGHFYLLCQSGAVRHKGFTNRERAVLCGNVRAFAGGGLRCPCTLIRTAVMLGLASKGAPLLHHALGVGWS